VDKVLAVLALLVSLAAVGATVYVMSLFEKKEGDQASVSGGSTPAATAPASTEEKPATPSSRKRSSRTSESGNKSN
jgi:hypothetical protein